MIDFSDVRIFLCTTPTNVNCSFDRLMDGAQGHAIEMCRRVRGHAAGSAEAPRSGKEYSWDHRMSILARNEPRTM